MTFAEKRTLTEYPRGAYRWTLLLLTVVATMLASFEFQLAPILSLLLPYLHLTKIGYGYFVSFSVLVSAVSALFGGPFADRYGRVILIDVCLAIVLVLVFANLAIRGIESFVIVRTLMAIVAGVMVGAGAALVRDMSPRLNRAFAFALLTVGPVGSNYLANLIAAATLPIFHTWQSQIWILGIMGIVMFVPVFLFLKDLSPDLRFRIYQSEVASIEKVANDSEAVAESDPEAGNGFVALLSHLEPWLMVVPFTVSLSLYTTIQGFGPLMFSEAFHYTASEAASIAAYFWLGNMGAVIVTGLSSDRLQQRKPVMIFGAILSSIVLMWWIPKFGTTVSRSTMNAVAIFLGGALAVTLAPWAAQYSEKLEEISPRLQATGWAFYGLVTRSWSAVVAPIMLTIAARYGWATWMKFTFAALILFAVAMFFTHPSAFPTGQTEVEPDAEAAVSGDF